MRNQDNVAARVRRTIIDIARRRQQPGTGSQRMERTAMMRWPNLTSVLHGIPWAIAGAVASRMYMPERATKDLDIVIRAEDAQRVRQRLESAGYVFVAPLGIPGFTLKSPEGAPVDVLEATGTWIDEALEAAGTNVDGDGAPVLTLPFLVLMKTRASRAHDVGDVARMLGEASDDDLDRVRAVIRKHYADATDDLESMIISGQLMRGAD